jgi:SAM-dependent methyltransferase
MFLAQDGVTVCFTLRGLERIGILEPSLAEERSLAELAPDLTVAGFGALRVAVHGLVATGWLTDPPGAEPAETVLHWTDAGRAAMRERRRYLETAEFIAGFDRVAGDPWTQPWGDGQVRAFAALVGDEPRGGARADRDWLVAAHLEGALAVPTMLSLHESGRLGNDRGPALPEGELGAVVGRFLAGRGWLDPGRAEWTELGRVASAFALHFGGVSTYLPLLTRLPELYRGELTVVPDPASGEPEWHVDRALNVRISALAHGRYFADSDPLFTEIFDRDPVAEQPRFIADMGCGQASWLAHLHQLVAEKTQRGKHLDQQPLTMIGIDPDPTAREEARRNLESAAIPALLLAGDVTDPDSLQRSLAEHGVAIEDGLHIRSFIDHERTYTGGSDARVPGWSSGIYIDADGGPLSGREVERDLVAHLRRWSRHVGKHGMIVLEAHCTAPEIVARHLGQLHGLAFDAHQAYSKQYPVDHPVFLECCREAGLEVSGAAEIRYPARRPFISISLNRLQAAPAEAEALPATGTGAARADSWQPPAETDLSDGRALHEIIFRRGDIRFPATWCAAPTGFVVGGALATIEARLETVATGETIRVLDYGAGTGTATIELLKACRARGLERRLADRGASIEVHLVDLPSSWYAQGYELLRGCAWTRFHSLRGEAGEFRPLTEVLAGAQIDVALANMVFHLIPPPALERTAAGLAEVLAPAAPLLWSAPDLGPALPEAVLLHDPNRALRERWLAVLAGASTSSPAVAEAAQIARRELDPEALRRAQDRADRRIRPRPLASEAVAALDGSFEGTVETATFEMLDEDVVRGLLVPSNQAEFMPEIADPELRERVIRELMTDHVLPELRGGPAGTGFGLNFHWTLGAHRKRR